MRAVHAAAPCTACRSPPGRPPPGRPRRAGRSGSRPRTAAGAPPPRRPAATAPGSRGRWRDTRPTGCGLTSAVTWPSGCWRKTAARSPSNRTIAWSTRPDRIRSRSSRLPMSVATRRSASARWSRWATSSARWAPLTIAPSASAATRATSRSRGPSEPGGLADDMEDAPRLARTGDRHGQLGAVVGEDRQRVVRPAVEQDAGHRVRGRSGPGRRPVRAPCRGSRSDRAGRPGGAIRRLRAGDRARREALAAGLPGHHEVMAVGIAEGVDRGAERLVGVLVDIDQPGQRRGDTEVEPMALGVERIGDRLFDDRGASAG